MNKTYSMNTIQSLQNLLNIGKSHGSEILKEKTIKDAHIYCKINGLSGQQTGPLIENYIREKCFMKKNKASDCNGDCKDRFMEDNEIKASGGGVNHNSYNYVQIRLNHKVDNYIFTAYHLTKDNYMYGGKLYLFKIKKKDMYPLIEQYGSYAHGTKSKLGKITLEDLQKTYNIKEYALRPKFGSELWNELLNYTINELEL